MQPLDYRSSAPGRWDFFFHAERRAGGVHPHDLPSKEAVAHFPQGTSLAGALAFMWSQRLMPKSSARAGCFEVQTPDGIFEQTLRNRMDLSTPARAAKIVGKTWTQLESEE